MKRKHYSSSTLVICLLVLFSFNTNAQQKIYEVLINNKNIGADLKPYLKKGEVVQFQKSIAEDILKQNQKNIDFTFQFENKEWIVHLEKNEILSPNFFASTSNNLSQNTRQNSESIHYKGYIDGKPKSLVAFSIMVEKLVAVLSDENGNINIGAINSNAAIQQNEYIIYRETDLKITNEFTCNTPEGNTNINDGIIPTYNAAAGIAATINPEPIDIYFEADYQTYLNNGSNVTNVVNYVTSLFNVVSVLYENDSVNVKISSIKVWDTADPYISLTSTSTVLNAFSTNMANGFPGDLAHFLSQRNLGGGIAYVNILCASDNVKTGVSANLSNSFNVFPTYSWSVMVVTHELGHNLGSPHTQSCSWPGGAIDNCYTTEGGCAAGPAPTNGGTIMSYCHLVSTGINLANGFGPLPGAKIRGYVRNNACIFPSVSFETTSQSVTEESADIVNGCLPYKLATVKLKLNYAASQPVNVTLVPTGNAGLIIGTNADVEVSPTSFVLTNAIPSQTINLKVYNDAQIENTETLTLNFNMNANGGNAIKKTTFNIHSLNIISEDLKPDSTYKQFYYESFEGITSGLGSFTQTIISGAASPNRWIINNTSTDVDFSSRAAYVSANNSTLGYAGGTNNDVCDIRLETPTINANGYTNLKVSFLLKCKGEFSGGTAQGGGTFYDYGRVSYSINDGSTWTILRDNIAGYNQKSLLEIPLPVAANNATNLKLAFEWLNDETVANNPPFIIDSLTLSAAGACEIQSLQHIGNSDEEQVGPNQTVHFYNPITKNVMATIENLSAFDFGCTKVELIRTGTTAATAWGVVASEMASSKAFKITTANTNNAAAYKLKLYYTDTEINGWLTTTGNIINDVRIVKTNGDITSTPPLQPAIFSSINNNSNFSATPNTMAVSTYTGNSSISNYAIMKPYGTYTCSNNPVSYATTIAGTAYQWEVNTGAGFVNVANSTIYSNATTNTLSITTAPLSYLGYKYRCKVTVSGTTQYSQEYYLKYVSYWLGTESTSWENPLNWSCNQVPDSKTDVVIRSSTPFSPIVSTSTSIRSLTTATGTNLVVTSGVNLIVNNQ